MQVIGLCRFSYPAIGGFQVEHDTVEARRRYLYATDRLDERFRLFETFTLPSLRAQTDGAFEFLIVIGDCLPTEAKDRLHDLTSGMPQVRIITRAPDEHRTVMKSVLNGARRDPSVPCLQFRLDDDDAVAIDFVERLRGSVQDCAGLINANPCAAIDFNNGYMAALTSRGLEVMQMYRSLMTAGLAMYVEGGCDLTIMNFAHQRLGRFMPVVTYPDTPMWIRTLNGYNDSPKARKGKLDLQAPDAEQRDELINRFALNLGQIART